MIMDKEAASWLYRQLGKFRGYICEKLPIHLQETRVIGAVEGLQTKIRRTNEDVYPEVEHCNTPTF
jgi:hypothetical protein